MKTIRLKVDIFTFITYLPDTTTEIHDSEDGNLNETIPSVNYSTEKARGTTNHAVGHEDISSIKSTDANTTSNAECLHQYGSFGGNLLFLITLLKLLSWQ